jgi:hypothetical protein
MQSRPIWSLVFFFCLGAQPPAAPNGLRFTVQPDHVRYDYDRDLFIDGRLGFSARITNPGPETWQISAQGTGNVVVTSIDCDGRMMPSSDRAIAFDEDPRASATAALQVVRPGGAVNLQISGPGSVLLEEGKPARLRTYEAPRRGKCELVFRYRYCGCPPKKGNVFVGELVSEPVVIEIR